MSSHERWRDVASANSALVSSGIGLLVMIAGLLLTSGPQRYLSYDVQSLPPYVLVLVFGTAAGLATYAVIEATWKPDLGVVARMVEALSAEGAMVKTKLCSRSGLSYTSFQKYLHWMEGHNLVTVVSTDGEVFSVALTEKGLESHVAYQAWLTKLGR